MNIRHGNISSMQDEMAHPTLQPLSDAPFMSRGEIIAAFAAVFVTAFVIGGLL